MPKKSNPKDDKLGGNIFHPGTFHPAAFSQHAFNNDEEGTGYKQYSFNPFTTTDPYGGTPVITRLVNVVSHFNRMIQTQPLWKTHKGFKRTKKMLEILLDDIYDDDSPPSVTTTKSASEEDASVCVDHVISIDDAKDPYYVMFWYY